MQKWINGQPIGFTVAGGRGSGATLNKISTSQGLYVDDQSRVYVSEIGNDRVTRWDNTTIGVIVCIVQKQIYYLYRKNNIFFHYLCR